MSYNNATYIAGVGYLIAVVIMYFLQFDFAVLLLTLPWSWVLSILGFLIIHMTAYGEELIAAGMLCGAVLNASIFVVARFVWQRAKSSAK